MGEASVNEGQRHPEHEMPIRMLSLLACASALTPAQPPMARRAVLGAALTPLVGAAVAANAEVYNSGKLNTPDSAGRRAALVNFGGLYSDPAHPGCTRKVKLAGTAAFITGADEDKVPFKVKGSTQGNTITIDFSPKGGPKDVTGVWIGSGIKFPDGNVWTKIG